MTYATARKHRSVNTREISVMFLDPALIKAARKIYRTYCNLNSQATKKPLGVAIDRDSYRGQLLFREKPILLPRECFIPLSQIEAEVY